MSEPAPKYFFLFAGSNYYPSGGMHDFIESFETYEAAEDYVKENNVYSYSGKKWDWYHIVDIHKWAKGEIELIV